jgi:hypothetical protein
MAAYCPFCGAEVDPATAAPGGLPHTLLCPVCGQEQDHPEASGQPAGQAPQTPPTAPPTPPPARPVAPALGGPEDWARPPEAPVSPPLAEGPAWESDAGLFTRLWRTTWQVLGHPGHTLGAPPRRPGLSWPLSYGLVLGTFSTAVTLLWGQALDSSGSALSTKAALWLLFLSPLITLVEMFFTTAVVHFSLFILGGAKNGFRASFRVNAYGEAAGLLAVVPVVGTAAVIIWHLVIMTAGLAAAHGIGKGRAFAAIILPAVLVMLLLMFVVMALGFTAMMAVLGELGKSGGGLGF